ncbi:MAG TPA: hypothetical protein VG605_23810 [Puia sp.]|jgi:hypothetical protein|nr:hypothetical protein [Puia sp.]
MPYDRNRRSFLKTSAGLLASSLMGGQFLIYPEDPVEKRYAFRPYRPGKGPASVVCVTPDDGYYLHTFFDICPWSVSGRYFAVTKLPYQKKKPLWGDVAEVCVIDLQKQTIRTVYRTKAWGFQLGAHLQWSHESDRYLYTNDIIGGKAVCVRVDLKDNSARAYAGAMYDLAPDDGCVISPNLLNMNMTQYGYGVPDPPAGRPVPFTAEDMPREGLWKTDLSTNERSLLASFPRMAEAADGEDREFYGRAVLYLFHSQFNRQQTRILQVLRGQVNDKGRNASLFTMDVNGGHIRQCLTRKKWNYKGRRGGSGNHPNWHPDGEHIVMNCIPRWLGYEDMLFCQFRWDGGDFKILSERHPGSGHPSIGPDGRYLLADAYPKQGYIVGADGEIPIRLLDLRHDQERVICTMANDVGGGGKQYLEENEAVGGSQYKLDPHPVWHRNGRQVAFNGAPEGRRQVYIADLSSML